MSEPQSPQYLFTKCTGDCAIRRMEEEYNIETRTTDLCTDFRTPPTTMYQYQSRFPHVPRKNRLYETFTRPPLVVLKGRHRDQSVVWAVDLVGMKINGNILTYTVKAHSSYPVPELFHIAEHGYITLKEATFFVDTTRTFKKIASYCKTSSRVLYTY